MSGTGEAERLVAELARAQGHDAREPIRARLRELGALARRALLAALADPDPFARWEAVSLLGEEAAPEAAEMVAEFALAEQEVHARWRSFWAVSRFPAGAAVRRLVAGLSDDVPARRWNAALALAMQGRPEARDAVIAGLGAADAWTQWEALAALRCLRAPAARE